LCWEWDVTGPEGEFLLEKKKLSRAELYCAWLGLACLALTVLAVFLVPASIHRLGGISWDGYYRSFVLRLYLILAGVFLTAFGLEPASTSVVQYLRQRWRDGYTYGALAGMCVVLWGFILHFGRRQFGAWDYNIMIDTGWRQMLGQRPYVDFVTPNPPGFNLGIKYAYELFGVSWNANLYLTSAFACATFLWMYWLMRKVSLGQALAALAAFAIESAGVLTLCFWWYNNSVLILAAVFFLACLAYAREPGSAGVQTSYAVSLALLSLMKPNIAGVTMVGGFVLLLVVTDRKLRLVLLTLSAAVAALLVLAVNHVSIAAMLASYRGVAKARGGFGLHSYYQMAAWDRHAALLWIAVLAIPLLGLVPRALRLLMKKDWKGVALSLMFPLAFVIAVYGLTTNGEFRDLECTVLLAAGAVLSFGKGGDGPLLRRVYIAILCASIAGDVYYGAERVRVYGIGPQMFFDWQDDNSRIGAGFLKDMRVSSRMVEVQREVGAAIGANPGPIFLGPRLEYDYAVFGLTSPEHFPVYWQPDVSFPQSEQSRLVQVWKDAGFKTLIFQRFAEPPTARGCSSMNYTCYTDEFFDAIERGYVRDDRYGAITVYHRREP
jgi:hypothetical protein